MAYNPCLTFIRTQHGSQISFANTYFTPGKRLCLIKEKRNLYMVATWHTYMCYEVFWLVFLIKMVITSICFAIIFRMIVSFLHYKCLSKRIAYALYKNYNLLCLMIYCFTKSYDLTSKTFIRWSYLANNQ